MEDSVCRAYQRLPTAQLRDDNLKGKALFNFAFDGQT
jgi:hypothetical protein